MRPEDLDTRRKLINADRYGDAKLSGEESLKDQQGDPGRPWSWWSSGLHTWLMIERSRVQILKPVILHYVIPIFSMAVFLDGAFN